MATTVRPVTAEEFERLSASDDAARRELIRGEILEMSPAGPRHGECCAAIAAILYQAAVKPGLGRVATCDPGVILERNPDTVRAPDVAYWSRVRLPELPDGFTDVPPDLAVEVVSPSDTHRQVQEKAIHWLDHGVPLVWVVDPQGRMVMVYRSPREIRVLREDEETTGEPALPGFTCRVGEFFA